MIAILATHLPIRKKKMPLIARTETPRRFRRARKNASLDSVQKRLEDLLGLPYGSVKLILPSGRKARGDSSVESLRRSWE